MTTENFKRAKQITDTINSLKINLKILKEQYPIKGQSFFSIHFPRVSANILDTEICNLIIKQSIEVIEYSLNELSQEFENL